MLFHLFQFLERFVSGFNVFGYITFRAALAALSAFLACLCLGPPMIRKLKKLKVGQVIRKGDAPDLERLHNNKEGTPTMGGLLIISAVVISTLLWCDWTNIQVWICLIGTVILCTIGAIDDYLKLVRNHSGGLGGRYKLAGQFAVGIGIAAVLFFGQGSLEAYNGNAGVPFLKEFVIPFGILYLLFVPLVIVGTSNAVNLTDGLDGLAAGSVVMAGLGYSVIAYIVGNANMSAYLLVEFIPGTHEVAIFAAGVVGATMGFLWWNAHPAQVMMGDTGSLSLGGALAIIAVLTKQEFLLVIVGGLFVLEALSVILQVASFKLRGKRIFKMAPLHHHFEMLGWSETQVTVRFWILAALFALLGLATLKVR